AIATWPPSIAPSMPASRRRTMPRAARRSSKSANPSSRAARPTFHIHSTSIRGNFMSYLDLPSADAAKVSKAVNAMTGVVGTDHVITSDNQLAEYQDPFSFDGGKAH